MMFEQRTHTDWSYQKPETHGVFERQYRSGLGYAYWDGSLWYFVGHLPDEAVISYKEQHVSEDQHLPWRGLTKQGYMLKLEDLKYA